MGVAAQIAIPLPFTPVPLTLQTFAVLLVEAALGSGRGVLSMGLYALKGIQDFLVQVLVTFLASLLQLS